jgi:hypothetical protein
MIEARARTADLGPGRSVPLTITEDGARGTVLLLRGRGDPGSVQGIAARLSGTMRVRLPSSRLERRLAVGRQDLSKKRAIAAGSHSLRIVQTEEP